RGRGAARFRLEHPSHEPDSVHGGGDSGDIRRRTYPEYDLQRRRSGGPDAGISFRNSAETHALCRIPPAIEPVRRGYEWICGHRRRQPAAAIIGYNGALMKHKVLSILASVLFVAAP